MIIDCISDLHGSFPELDGGDLLIVAGDCTTNNSVKAWLPFFEWFHVQNYRKKIWIAGNHDKSLVYCISSQEHRDLFGEPDDEFEYLCDSGYEFEGLKIWGAPWTPWFMGVNPDCDAFMLKTKTQLMEKWQLIPDDTDILVTHGPPFGTLDMSHWYNRYGCKALADRVRELKLKLHVFGHIHEGYGQQQHEGRHLSVNCSHMNSEYEPVNKPIRVVL